MENPPGPYIAPHYHYLALSPATLCPSLVDTPLVPPCAQQKLGMVLNEAKGAATGDEQSGTSIEWRGIGIEVPNKQ